MKENEILKELISAARALTIAAEENNEYESDINLQEAVGCTTYVISKAEKELNKQS